MAQQHTPRTNGQGKSRRGGGEQSPQQQQQQQQQIAQRGRQGSALAPNTRAMRDPFSLLRSMVEDIDGVFQRFGMGRMSPWSQGQPSTGAGGFSPQLEVFRRGDQLVVHADLPGMDKDGISIDIDEQSQQLVISGERQQSREWDEQGVMHTERSYGSFYRAVPLPEGVDLDTCKASFDNGVLEICMDMPRRTSNPRARRISIE